MVELRVDSLQASDVPHDCFVAVRLGEAQKLARLASTRVFRFPQAAADCRTGKIEVFRRLGGASIDVDAEDKRLRKVSVNCGEKFPIGADGSRKIDLHIAVEESQDDNIEHKKKRDSSAKSVKVRTSKDYLRRHGVEAKLTEAMQAVLRERPENPTDFLAAKFLSWSQVTLAEDSSPQFYISDAKE